MRGHTLRGGDVGVGVGVGRYEVNTIVKIKFASRVFGRVAVHIIVVLYGWRRAGNHRGLVDPDHGSVCGLTEVDVGVQPVRADVQRVRMGDGAGRIAF